MNDAKTAVSIPFRVLFLRSTRADYLAFGWAHMLFGLVCTWLVGMGRYWDNPRVETLQHLGVGSLVYVFALSTLLWLVGLPFRNDAWRYRIVLTMVVLASPPAAIYAIPVERWVDFEGSRDINVTFLEIVAFWRMLIWGRFVWVLLPVNVFARTTVILMPIAAIVFSLFVLNLEKAVFDIMAGLLPASEGTTEDAAYIWLMVASAISVYFGLPILLISYVVNWVVYARQKHTQLPAGIQDS